MPDDARYRDPRFMALEADPDYQEYLAEREKAGVPWLAGTELHDALYKQGWAARYEKLLVRHGIALGEIEFEPTTWPAPASIAEMEQRLTRLIDLDESATRIWRRAGYGDPPATEKHADDARCIARMVDKLGVDATAPLRRIGPKLTRDEEQDIYLELLGLVRAAQKTAEPPAQANAERGEPALTEDQLKVLRTIVESPVLLKGPDAYVDVAERAGKTALQSLEVMRLIHRPKGKRSGYGATAKGKIVVASQKRTVRAP